MILHLPAQVRHAVLGGATCYSDKTDMPGCMLCSSSIAQTCLVAVEARLAPSCCTTQCLGRRLYSLMFHMFPCAPVFHKRKTSASHLAYPPPPSHHHHHHEKRS